MLVKVTQPIVNYEGQPMVHVTKNGKDRVETPLLLRNVLVESLNFQDPQKLPTFEESVRIYDLSVLIMNAEDVELSEADVELIKPRLAKAYKPVVIGQVVKVLTGQIPQA